MPNQYIIALDCDNRKIYFVEEDCWAFKRDNAKRYDSYVLANKEAMALSQWVYHVEKWEVGG